MGTDKKVLLVEDDEIAYRVVKDALRELCELIYAPNLTAARAALDANVISLIVLDVHLPDGDGFEFCKELRLKDKYSTLPVIFLTGRADVADRVLGFDLGADDYVVKPLEPREFSARIAAQIRKRFETSPTISRGSFYADMSTLSVSTTSGDGRKQPLPLTPTEAKLMIHFLQNEGKIFSREDLIKKIWGDTTHISPHTVDTHISSLRKKIAGDVSHTLKSIMRKGYCLQNKATTARS